MAHLTYFTDLPDLHPAIGSFLTLRSIGIEEMNGWDGSASGNQLIDLWIDPAKATVAHGKDHCLN